MQISECSGISDRRLGLNRGRVVTTDELVEIGDEELVAEWR
jgi:hypothetical protein